MNTASVSGKNFRTHLPYILPKSISCSKNIVEKVIPFKKGKRVEGHYFLTLHKGLHKIVVNLNNMLYCEPVNGGIAGPNTVIHMIELFDLEGLRPRQLMVQEEVEHLYDNPVFEGRNLTRNDTL